MDVFFSDEDKAEYLKHISEQGDRFGVSYIAWCLMTNHVHLIAIPQEENSLALGIGEAHRRYTRSINFREGWRGHLWQGRFASYVMDEHYLLSCIRYIERNPVRAKLAAHPAEWRWSSARAHIDGATDGIVNVSPLLDLAGADWGAFLEQETSSGDVGALRRHERTGRPLGGPAFVDMVESQLGRCLRRNTPGPKPAKSR